MRASAGPNTNPKIINLIIRPQKQRKTKKEKKRERKKKKTRVPVRGPVACCAAGEVCDVIKRCTAAEFPRIAIAVDRQDLINKKS